jgi:hypothetical protein
VQNTHLFAYFCMTNWFGLGWVGASA